jgi:hypothetical protein
MSRTPTLEELQREHEASRQHQELCPPALYRQLIDPMCPNEVLLQHADQFPTVVAQNPNLSLAAITWLIEHTTKLSVMEALLNSAALALHALENPAQAETVITHARCAITRAKIAKGSYRLTEAQCTRRAIAMVARGLSVLAPFDKAQVLPGVWRSLHALWREPQPAALVLDIEPIRERLRRLRVPVVEQNAQNRTARTLFIEIFNPSDKKPAGFMLRCAVKCAGVLAEYGTAAYANELDAMRAIVIEDQFLVPGLTPTEGVLL